MIVPETRVEPRPKQPAVGRIGATAEEAQRIESVAEPSHSVSKINPTPTARRIFKMSMLMMRHPCVDGRERQSPRCLQPPGRRTVPGVELQN